MNNMSILGSLKKDIAFFYVLPIFVFISMFFVSSSFISDNVIVTFLIFLFIDMGHAYATLFRTYFRIEEIKRDYIYLYLPIIVFSLIFLWAYFGIPYLWSFILYFTFFHHIRQYYGIYMWYSSKNTITFKENKYHLYLLTTIPFLIFHFRSITHEGLYHQDELFLFGENNWTQISIVIYLIYLLVQSLRWVNNDNLNKGTKIALVYPSVIHAFCFLYFQDSFKAFIPLLVMHGVSYVVLIIFSIKKIMQNKSVIKIIGSVLLTILICVLLESYLLDNYDVFVETKRLKNNFLLSSLASLAVLPNLLHYIFDAIIWKKNNPDFKKIIS